MNLKGKGFTISIKDSGEAFKDNMMVFNVASCKDFGGIDKIIFEGKDGSCIVFSIDENHEKARTRSFRDMDGRAFSNWMYDQDYSNVPSSLDAWIPLGTIKDLICCAIEEIWPSRRESMFTDMDEDAFMAWLRTKHPSLVDALLAEYKPSGNGQDVPPWEYEVKHRVALVILDDAVKEIKEERSKGTE